MLLKQELPLLRMLSLSLDRDRLGVEVPFLCISNPLFGF